jgi:cytochrome P450
MQRVSQWAIGVGLGIATPSKDGLMSEECDYATLFATVDPELVRCPYPAYETLRHDRPVQWLEGMGAYAVTRYEDMMSVLKRAGEFSSARQSGPGAATNLAVRVAEDSAYSDDLRAMAARRVAIAKDTQVLVNADPPQHSRQRRLLNRTFSPARVALLEPDIQSLTDELIDKFAGRGTAELISELALPLPMTVITRALGVEGLVDQFTLKRWSDSFVRANGNPALSTEQITELFSSMMEAYDFFTEQLEVRLQTPSDDLLNDVAHAKMGDDELTFNEKLQISTLLMIAGNETTTSLIGSATLMLLRNQPLREKMIADPSLIPAYVEESLRLEPPTQGMFRIAKSDTEIGGVQIPAGSFLWLIYASGNRDVDAFAKPDDVDLLRDDGHPHLSFGGGPHFCLGANLARAEARIALETLLRRLPGVELAPDEDGDEWFPNLIQHALARLNVTFPPTG